MCFKDVYRSYDSLEGRISEVGRTAIRIGEQLETIDKERSKASESRDIIEYFMEFQDGSSERLDSLCKGGEEGQLKVISLKSWITSSSDLSILFLYIYICRLPSLPDA